MHDDLPSGRSRKHGFQSGGLPVLLITTAVRAAPAANVRVSDHERRLEYTLEGIGEWVARVPELRIVVCDGSNVDLTATIREKWPTANIEVLHFQNNERKVARFGKGFGEGQIIRFALRKSTFLRRAPVFMKCTGKLWVDNAREVLAAMKRPNAFRVRRRRDADGRRIPVWVDTRFFVVETAFFRKHLVSAYRDVDSASNRYIEHVYSERLARIAGPSKFKFRVRPQVRGVSGSTGVRR